MARMIDADALIGELHTTYLYDDNARKVIYRKIEEQPTIELESWIGADKRPKKPGKYIVYGVTMFVPDHNGEPCGYWEIKIANWSDKWGWDCKVKCWRPRPKLPKELLDDAKQND